MNSIERPTRFEERPIAPRRAALFQETPLAALRRYILGAVWALRPSRISRLIPIARVSISHLMHPSRPLPETEALAPHTEIVGLATDLTPATLMDAYARGLFPHGHIAPLKWVCPTDRAVVRPQEFHISSRLRSIMRKNRYRVTFDTDFEGVIGGCAAPRRGWLSLTWITPQIMAAYAKLFDAGHVHSFEVWNKNGELAGGGYGVAVGRVFVIESQFFRESNASKIGFAVLAWHLAKWGFVLIDNKWLTTATERAGFGDIPRQDYFAQLPEPGEPPIHPGRWQAEADPKAVVSG
ncbi:MAG: leucyl/phenylalanyl-tRNA--protein transferase [Methyloceanibacter sp.]|nr:leucyl/phenylalanyl-tRNA--protein transferase [Methyloceanibacter sp.]